MKLRKMAYIFTTQVPHRHCTSVPTFGCDERGRLVRHVAEFVARFVLFGLVNLRNRLASYSWSELNIF